MKVLVCGGRDFTAQVKLEVVLDLLHARQPITRLIHGAARGADSMAGTWARRVGVSEVPYPADWDTYGRRAGPVRNQRMLDIEKPQLVIAFPGGVGTRDMVNRSRTAGVPVWDLRALSFD